MPATNKRGSPARKTRGPASLLQACAGRKVCVVGIGNRHRGDDGAGPAVLDRIAGRVAASCLDAGVAPENYLEKIAASGAEVVLLVDAVAMGAKPGQIAVLSARDVGGGGISTHAPSLQMVCAYLAQRIQASVLVVGIQPAKIADAIGLSPGVESAVARLSSLLVKAMTAK